MDDAQAVPDPPDRDARPQPEAIPSAPPAGDAANDASAAATAARTKVTIACAHLAFARYPVMVGHYRGDTFAARRRCSIAC